MKKLKILLIALLLTGSLFAQTGVFYNVKDYGAKGDGQTIDTKAIEAAIDAAAAKGGGTVFFPAGNYQNFTIHLKSFITLHLDNGATLEAADVKKFGLGYDPAEPNPWDMYQDFGHSHWRNSLIYGENLQKHCYHWVGDHFWQRAHPRRFQDSRHGQQGNCPETVPQCGDQGHFNSDGRAFRDSGYRSR